MWTTKGRSCEELQLEGADVAPVVPGFNTRPTNDALAYEFNSLKFTRTYNIAAIRNFFRAIGQSAVEL